MAAKAKTWGYIYIIRSLDRYKIGYSGDLKTLDRRLNQLRLMNAYPPETLLILLSRRAHKIETELHRQFDAKRLHGEWFELQHSDVVAIARKHLRLIHEINFEL